MVACRGLLIYDSTWAHPVVWVLWLAPSLILIDVYSFVVGLIYDCNKISRRNPDIYWKSWHVVDICRQKSRHWVTQLTFIDKNPDIWWHIWHLSTKIPTFSDKIDIYRQKSRHLLTQMTFIDKSRHLLTQLTHIEKNSDIYWHIWHLSKKIPTFIGTVDTYRKKIPTFIDTVDICWQKNVREAF